MRPSNARVPALTRVRNLLEFEPVERFSVREVLNKGRGLFAEDTFHYEEKVIFYKGERLTKDQYEALVEVSNNI